jgi:hypothetical protein
MKYRIDYDRWRNLYVSTLLGGEFNNCWGQGRTPEGSYISLKLAVRVRRKNAHTKSQALKVMEGRKNGTSVSPCS